MCGVLTFAVGALLGGALAVGVIALAVRYAEQQLWRVLEAEEHVTDDEARRSGAV